MIERLLPFRPEAAPPTRAIGIETPDSRAYFWRITYLSALFGGKGLLWLIFAGLGVAILFVPWPFSPAPTTRHFIVDSRQFQYEPGILQVNRGDTVILTLTASDVVHGLYLDGYSLQMRVEPGQSQTLQFVADQPGKFRYRCSVSCGTLHPFMIGELIVGPNTLFGRAVALLALVVVGALVYLRCFPPRQPGEAL